MCASEIGGQPRGATEANLRGFAEPFGVLHITAVETENYYLNNLVDQVPPDQVRLSFATVGADRGFVSALRGRGVTAQALGTAGRRNLPKAAWRLAKLIRATQPELLHAHEFELTLLSVVLASLMGCGVVRTRHYSDAIHRLRNPLKRYAYGLVERWINARAHAIVAPALQVYDILVRREGVDPEKVRLVPYGQARARFDSVSPEEVGRIRDSLGVARGLLLVCVARLHPEKGHRHLLEAFAQLRQEGFEGTLCLVGTGTERETLETCVKRLGLAGRVRFLGWRDDALLIIAAADAVVHSSLHEALSSAVIEALALGRPVVATDVSGVRDVLGDSEFGIVVAPGDTRALLEGMRRCLGDLARWHRRAAVGANRLFEHMSPERTARDHVEVYAAAMARARVRADRRS